MGDHPEAVGDGFRDGLPFPWKCLVGKVEDRLGEPAQIRVEPVTPHVAVHDPPQAPGGVQVRGVGRRETRGTHGHAGRAAGRIHRPGPASRPAEGHSTLRMPAVRALEPGPPDGREPAGLAASTWRTALEYLFDVLHRLHRTTGQRVVILVDEYDKPILDGLHDPDVARANRECLRGVYGIIKGSAEHVRFVLVTGVSMFSKVNLFSDLNNLEDISLNPHFAPICSYTDADLNSVFAPELDGLDRDEIRRWYNGFSWLGTERPYNPFDVLLLFGDRKFNPYWFETGSPRFLFETLKAKSVSPLEIEGCLADESLVSKFEIEDISADALLFQTGYLTITDEIRRGHRTFIGSTTPIRRSGSV